MPPQKKMAGGRLLSVGATPLALRVGAIAPPKTTLLHAPGFYICIYLSTAIFFHSFLKVGKYDLFNANMKSFDTSLR